MSTDVYQTVRNCALCTRERVELRKHASYLKLFPATHLMEFVGIDLLGPLRRSSRGNKYLLFIADRFSKLKKTALPATSSAYTVAKAFCEQRVFHYGIPA